MQESRILGDACPGSVNVGKLPVEVVFRWVEDLGVVPGKLSEGSCNQLLLFVRQNLELLPLQVLIPWASVRVAP